MIAPMIARPHRFAFKLFAAVIILWLAAMFVLMRASLLPGDATGTMLAVFDPSISSDDAFSAITRAGAKPIRRTAFGFIWVVDGTAGNLTREGAIGAYRDLPISAELAGCVAVADAKIAELFSP
jgi:hypothetical protein